VTDASDIIICPMLYYIAVGQIKMTTDHRSEQMVQTDITPTVIKHVTDVCHN